MQIKLPQHSAVSPQIPLYFPQGASVGVEVLGIALGPGELLGSLLG